MFDLLGRSVAKRPLWWLAFWVITYATARWAAPEWNSVVKDGEFAFLPESTPSRQGDLLYESAFPAKANASSIVLLVRRTDVDDELTDDDRKQLEDTLVDDLRQLVPAPARQERGSEDRDESRADSDRDAANARMSSLVTRVRSPSDELTGPLLVADDRRAALIVIELSTDFLDLRNRELVNQVEDIATRWQLEYGRDAGLEYVVSGSASVGRDLAQARASSAHATETMTVVLVIVLLALIHRSPLPALIPLITVYISVKLARYLLALMAGANWIGLFDGIQVYITVIVYGAGVDYCMFLTARYREELLPGVSYGEALATTVSRVGATLVASAGTVIGGIGMLVFAEFGKFQEAGIAIAFSLVVVLCATLTLSSVLLRLSGRWVFWLRPRNSNSNASDAAALEASASAADSPFTPVWQRVGETITRHPKWTLGLCLAAFLVPSTAAVVFHQYLDYGFINSLPDDAPSVQGTQALQDHFPAGMTGPLTVLIQSPTADFSSLGVDVAEGITEWLQPRFDELRVADLRSIAHPLGVTQSADRAWEGFTPGQRLTRRGVLKKRAADYYVSQNSDGVGHVMRLDVILRVDPFSREGIIELNQIEPPLRAELQKLVPDDSVIHFTGATASIRDLKTVRERDQVRICSLVSLSVFVILVLLLRRPVVSLYLVASVLLSYTATYGVTLGVFWLLDPAGFAGLDWKLPLLLFTILVAVGEDYNIFLLSRVAEEQQRHGPVQGVIAGLSKTGGIISSCGVIMAGTFAALLFGALDSMRQLGFALAFGVLLDTFVVRPILVPAFLVLWYGTRPENNS